MDNAAPATAMLKLMTWLSPSYPVGAYTYSHGLEQAVQAGNVNDIGTTQAWVTGCLRHGAGRTDAILLAHAWRAIAEGAAPTLDDLTDLTRALAPSAERLLETEAQGAAFGHVTATVWARESGPLPYPLAVGAAAADHWIGLREVVEVYLHAFAANLISAAIRLVPLGQTDGQRIVAALMPVCGDIAADAIIAPLDDVGGCAMLADIASMRHEVQTTRIFRS